MCYGCWKERGSPTIRNDKVTDAVDAVQKMYEVHGAGGSMHIVTDDWNLEDHNIEFCAGLVGQMDDLEKRCLKCFQVMTIEERASALGYGFTEEEG